MNAHDITKRFEEAVAEYTGSPYCVALDNESNALYLALVYVGVENQSIIVPSHTYPSVPCEIIRAGGSVKFEYSPVKLKGAYYLRPTNIIDSALRFTADMYIPGTFICLSFTGPHKRLKTVKGGAILTDNKEAYEWFKRARFSGRRECSYFDDDFDMLGWNYYMPPILASIGLTNLAGFYNKDGSKKHFDDLELEYPDLSKFEIYKT